MGFVDLFVGKKYYPNLIGFKWFVDNVLPSLTDNIQVDIVDNINSMLNIYYVNAKKVNVNARIIQQMRYEDFANKYPYSYISKHKCNSGKELSLYHLMFDFSQNIQ